jgi:hypothetical protein
MHIPSCTRRLTGALAIVVLLGPGACGRSSTEPIARETFIDVIVDLRAAHRTTDSPEAFEAKRTEILERAGVTDSLLVEFVRAHGRDTGLLSALWDTINVRLLERADER